MTLAGGVAVVMLLGAASSGRAQVDRRDVPIATQPQQRFNSGQDIQPIFEGWTLNDDRSYNFLFGYLNRNYMERPASRTAGSPPTSIRARIAISSRCACRQIFRAMVSLSGR